MGDSKKVVVAGRGERNQARVARREVTQPTRASTILTPVAGTRRWAGLARLSSHRALHRAHLSDIDMCSLSQALLG